MRFLLSVLAVAAIVYALCSMMAPSGEDQAARAARLDARWVSKNAKTPPEWFVMRGPVKITTLPPLDQFVIESN